MSVLSQATKYQCQMKGIQIFVICKYLHTNSKFLPNNDKEEVHIYMRDNINVPNSFNNEMPDENNNIEMGREQYQ